MERVPNIDAALAPPGDCCQSPFDSSPRDWHAQCSAPLRQPLARRPLASVAAHYGGDRSVSHASSSTATGGEGDGEGDSQASVSIAFDEGCVHVLKGAAVSVLRIPVGRTTASVKQLEGHAGRLVLNEIKSFSEEQRLLIGHLANQKVKEDAPFLIWNMPRKAAEELYGDTMYDVFNVPDSVTELRLVNLERWSLNAGRFDILKSTGLLGRFEITKAKHNANKQQLEISFECFPGNATPVLAETLQNLSSPPPLSQAIPDLSAPAPELPQELAAEAAAASSAKPDSSAASATQGKKEKKPRPAAPPPSPALATASLLIRGAAAHVLGLRVGISGADLQPVWVMEPGHGKITMNLDSATRADLKKEEIHAALIDAIEDTVNRFVRDNIAISILELGRARAKELYGDGVLDSSMKSDGDSVRVAYVPGVLAVEIPDTWTLCGLSGSCGTITFRKAVDPSSKKKPETAILYKKKELSIRYEVAEKEASGESLCGGDLPSADIVRELDNGMVRIQVPGVDAAAIHDIASGGEPVLTGSVAFDYPVPGGPADAKADVYWSWFRKALGKRLQQVGCTRSDLLKNATAVGLRRTCAEFGAPLSEVEVSHLEKAPVSADWLGEVLAGLDMPIGDGTESVAGGAAEEEMEVDPWNVSGKIDYRKLVEKFGSQEISPELLKRVESLTVGRGNVDRLHPWLTRGIFFSHRDLDQICTCVEKGQPFYLYTGRGPSSAAMHLGHLIPFLMTKWLQDAFDVPLVIQMTDDEKFLWKGLWEPESGDNLMKYRHLTTENAKDIIACGFKKDKTFIFSDLEYVGEMYPNIVRIWKAITYNTARSAFGFQGESNIGQSAFPAIQAAPSFPSSFPTPLGGQEHMACMIPCAIDQDPYFRITRDIAHKLVPQGHPLKGKPALLHSKFFPPLQGATGKMSASDESTAIFLTDSHEDIDRKIRRYAFSGGRVTAKEQREKGADLDVDVSYQWLRFFLEDEEELAKIGDSYGSGQGDYWNTDSVKTRLIKELQKIVGEHQARRNKISDVEVEEWMAVRKLAF